MLRNYVVTALRNLERNQLYTAISVGGLAVAFAAALLITIFVADEFSYDRWIPGAKDVYQVASFVAHSDGHSQHADTAQPNVAGWMKLHFPEIEAVARLWSDRPTVRRGQVEAVESLMWADPDVFEIFPLPTVAGDLKGALARPDSLVLTQTLARKYFGDANPIGQTLLIEKHPMRVTAVLRDLPSNTHLAITMVASGKAPFSALSWLDAQPPERQPWNAYTYFRLKPGAAVKPVVDGMPNFVAETMPGAQLKNGNGVGLTVTAIADVHFAPERLSQMIPRGDRTMTLAVAMIGALIVLMAASNFVNLMTARAGRRAVEVGVRKLVGAERRNLIAQFIGETLIYAALGGLLALALSEFLLPALNALLGRRMGFSYGVALPMVLGLVVLIGALAGVYPALVMSSFRPATVLKGGPVQGAGGASLRQGLVALQFAVLIGLVVSTVVIWRQTVFATKESLRLDSDQMLIISAPCAPGAFVAEVAALPGVRGAACSQLAPLYNGVAGGARTAQGRNLRLFTNGIGFGFFELYGLKPLAGRFFSPAYGGDSISMADDRPDRAEAVVVNQTAMRELGFSKPADAVGKVFTWDHIKGDGTHFKPHPAHIIGVVEDFPINSIRGPIEPTGFYVQPELQQFINVKLGGHDIPETLAALDDLWRKSGRPGKADAVFLDRVVQDRYRDVTQQERLLGVFAGVAVFIACIGLAGLAAFTTERRTKEVGVRKAVGASTFDVLRLFLWQFTVPVLWANLLAWPLAFLAMRRWLQGFAYRIPLTVWPFALAAVAAVLIAWLTVLAQASRAARARPVTALRYE